MSRTLLPRLFPLVRAEVLRLLFTDPRQELYVRELARLSGLSLQTVQDELATVEAAQLISSRSNRYQRFYRADAVAATVHFLSCELLIGSLAGIDLRGIHRMIVRREDLR